MFEKYSNTKFHENLSSGNQVISCRWTDGEMTHTHTHAHTHTCMCTHTHMKTLIVTFHNFANMPIKIYPKKF